MEFQRKNSGAEQEKWRSELQRAQESIKKSSKETKEFKTKLSQVRYI